MSPTSPTAIAELDEAALDAALQQPGAPPLLLDLWAPWCAPCRAMTPVLQRLADAAEGRLQVAKLNVDQHGSMAKRFAVRSIPCLILFRAGVEVSRRTGPQTREQLARWLGEEGIDIGHVASSFPSEPAPWGAFYGDEGLRGFLGQRWQRLAASGRLMPSRFPSWSDERGSVSAALVHSPRPDVFERVTGMPYAVACAMEMTGASAADEVAALFAALPVNADLRGVPIRLVMQWLADTELPWRALLDDAAADALRLRWLATSAAALSADGASTQDWSGLRADTATLTSHDPQRTVQNHFGNLLAALSPPPSPDDASAWVDALLLRGTYLRSALLQSRLGWTRADFAVELFRHQWFQARIPHPQKLNADEMNAWRRRYESENAELEGRHAALQQRFRAERDVHMKPMNDRLRGQLLALLRQAPKV